MRLKEIKLNSKLQKMEVSEVTNVIEGIDSYINFLTPLIHQLSQTNLVEVYGTDAPYVILDALEDFSQVRLCRESEIFAYGLCADSVALNNRISQGELNIRILKGLAETYALASVPLTDGELSNVTEVVTVTLANFSYFIYHLCQLDAVKEGNTEDIIAPLYNYLAKTGTNTEQGLIDFTEKYSKLVKKFKPALEIFEEYPEYEEMFYDVVGPLAYDFSKVEDILKLNDVLAIINQNESAESVLNTLLNKSE